MKHDMVFGATHAYTLQCAISFTHVILTNGKTCYMHLIYSFIFDILSAIVNDATCGENIF